jgi:hypothetical protein
MSRDNVLMTREDPQEPALLASAPSVYYRAFSQEISQVAEQGSELPVKAAVATLTNAQIGQDEVGTILDALGIAHAAPPEDYAAILDQARSGDHPYKR